MIKGEEEDKKLEDSSNEMEITNNNLLLVDLCASNLIEMQQWMNAIRDFHNCDVKEDDDENTPKPDPEKKEIMVEVEREQKDEEEIKMINEELDGVNDLFNDSISIIYHIK